MVSTARFTEAKLPLGREEKATSIIVQFKYLGNIPSEGMVQYIKLAYPKILHEVRIFDVVVGNG